MSFQELFDFINDYTNSYSPGGIVKLVFDLLIIIALFGFVVYAIRKKVSAYKLIIVVLGYLVIYFLAFTLGLRILSSMMNFISFFAVLVLIITYSQDLKHTIDSFFANRKVDNEYSTKEEKDQVISIICQTADYLSKRSIGALMIFEREDSLGSIIDKAIKIDSVVTHELLTTIFTPGTACHDGGVIIRNNRIVCAGAYYILSDNYDIPKILGTRHRAAIGISEKYDAITIVVSEETGNISLTSSSAKVKPFFSGNEGGGGGEEDEGF